jgi:hypothetical protein
MGSPLLPLVTLLSFTVSPSLSRVGHYFHVGPLDPFCSCFLPLHFFCLRWYFSDFVGFSPLLPFCLHGPFLNLAFLFLFFVVAY